MGATESELTRNSVPYEFGISRYRELARGQIAGDSYGMLKLLVSTADHKLLGVQIFGTAATELIHIGQAVMGCGGTVEYLVDAVLNYPTFSEGLQGRGLGRDEQDPRRPRFPLCSVLDPSGAGGAGHATGLGLFSWFRIARIRLR